MSKDTTTLATIPICAYAPSRASTRMEYSHILGVTIMLGICYVIAIFLNFIMSLHVIFMREGNMVVEIFMLLNYLSLC